MGFLNGLMDSFTGAGAKKELQKGRDQQQQFLQQGFDQGKGYGEQYLNQANGLMQGYMDRGQKASGMYGDLNGVNGADTARNAWSQFQAPPGFQEASDYAAKQTQNSAAARGSMYNGNTLAALYNQASGARYGAQNDWMNRLNGIGQQGYDATSQNANRTGQFGNALMQGRMGLGQQQSGVEGDYAKGMASASGSLAQNLIGLGGVVMGGFTPGKSGTSPFGNMYSSAKSMAGYT
jgi:hypothetical protein